MSAISISSPFPTFTDVDGDPLESGYIYVGQANVDPVTFPIAAYWDAALTIPAAQPIRTIGGYPARNGSPARIYANSDYSIRVTNKNGSLVYSAPAATDRFSGVVVDVDATDVAYTPAGTGAVATTVQEVQRRTVSVFDFMPDAQKSLIQAGNTVSQDATVVTAAIQAAIDYAYSFSYGNIVTGYDTIRTGGVDVGLPSGKYKTNATINLKDNVRLVGAGRLSTVITSSYNGPIIRNTTITNYDAFGLGLIGITIIGDRSKASQVGVAILRDWFGTYSDVVVEGCGSHGWLFMQCIHTRMDSIEGLECVGNGIRILDGQVSWVDATPNNLPSNTMIGINCHFYGNDAAGVYLGRQGSTGSSVNGCQFYGLSAEYNYKSSQGGGNTGYNIEVRCSSDVPNEFVNLWVEGGCQAHAYINCTNVATPTRFINLHHFGNGASGNVDRAIIAVQGQVFIDGAFGHGTQYKTISGSKAPFRLTKATASMRITNAQGSTITDNKFVEDENGLSTGLENNLLMNNFGKSYGLFTHRGPAGQIIQGWHKDTDEYPFLEVVPGYGLGFGDGTSGNPDAFLQRTAANVVGVRSGTSFNAGGSWNDSHLIMGGYHLWVDSSGRLRIKLGAPTSETDGTVVGTQT